MGHDDLRRRWFPDWTPEKEDVPEGIRGLVGSGTMPLMRDPDEEESWRTASLPGDGPEIPDRAYQENPHSLKPPRELRTLLNDPKVKGEKREQVTAAFDKLQELEGGGKAGRKK